MTDTVQLRPETRPVSLFLAVQHGMLLIFKGAGCSLLYSLAENFMVGLEARKSSPKALRRYEESLRYSHDSQDLLKLSFRLSMQTRSIQH